jgi:hypothetical protein
MTYKDVTNGASKSGGILFSPTRLTVVLALTMAWSGLQCGLKYQYWPMKHTLVVDQKGCQWRTVPIQFRQN